MARQVISLGVRAFGSVPVGGEWRGAVLLDPALVAGGGEAWLVEIDNIGVSIRIRLDATASGDGTAAGPEWTAALEGAAGALTFAEAGGASVTLPGPGHASNAFVDPTEPYFWTPRGTLWQHWLGALGDGEVTLTLDDGIEAIALRGAAEAGPAEARARLHPIPVHALGGVAAAGAPEIAAKVDALPALSLADFDADGLELDMLALIRAGAGPNDIIFAAPPRGTIGALVAGELGLGEDEVPITRIRRRNGTMLAFNDSDPLSLADYFRPGGAGADLTLTVKTHAGSATLPASTHGAAGGNFVQFGPIGTDLDAILDGIGDGDLFIVAFTRPARPVHGIAGRAAAGAAEARAQVHAVTPPVHALAGVAAAGLAEARASLRPVPVRMVGGRALGGAPEARLALRLVRTWMLHGTAAAGAAEAFAIVGREPPVSERFARSLRESASAERLVTALEISHPAVAAPVRVVNDTEDRVIEGERYIALRFDAGLADDVDGQAPQAVIAIDNVGRELTQWIEAAGGGAGATVRVIQVLAVDDPPIEWELTMDLAGVQLDAERITARLGFDPLLGRAAVTLRHDPQTSPGLF